MKNFYALLFTLSLAILGMPLAGQTPQGCLSLEIGTGTGTEGNIVCVTVSVKDFTDILSLQYTVRWDPDALAFTETTSYNLPDLSSTNFGASAALLNNGLMSLSWFPNNLEPVTLADGEAIYMMCFEILEAPGSDIYFFDNPTPVEIANGDEMPLGVNLIGGGVHTSTTDASMELSACAQHTSCNSISDGAIDLTVQGGTPPYTYNWNFGNTVEDVSGLAPGEYIVTVTDQIGTERVGRFLLGQYSDSFIESASITNASCGSNDNGAINVTVFGDVQDYQFLWATNETTPGISGLAPGTYSLQLTHLPSGCVINESYSVGLENGFALEAVLQQASCEDGQSGAIDLTVNGNWTGNLYYAWSNGVSTEDLTSLAPGLYEVTVTDDNGCSLTQSYIIYQETELDVTYTGMGPDCNGNTGYITLNLPGDPQDYTIVWSNGETTPTISNLPEGDYGVFVTDNNSGCVWGEQITLLASEFLTAFNYECTYFPDTSIVTVHVAVWAGGVQPYTFNWSDGSTGQDDFIGSTTGGGDEVYSVTITDAVGCSTVVGPIYPNCSGNNPDPDMLGLYIPSSSVVPGESVCVSVKTTNFTDIETLQFSLNWNEAVVAYSHVQNFGLQGLNAANFEYPTAGQLTFDWADQLGTGNEVTLPNGSTLFDVCFNAVAPGGATDISFSSTPLSIVASNGAGSNLTVNTNNGNIEIINDDNLPVEFSIPEVIVEQGATACVGVYANNYFDIIGTQFTLSWDPAVIEYANIVAASLPNVSEANFGNSQNNLDNGELPFSWFDGSLQGVTIANGGKLFDICFTAIGDEGTSSIVSVANSPVTIEVIRDNLELAAYSVEDGLISIESSNMNQAVVLQAGNASGETGDIVCTSITAEQFEDILSMQFSVQWDPSIATLETIFPNSVLPTFNINHFGFSFVNEGKLAVAWFNPALGSTTLAPGTELFELCFELTGPTGSYSPLWFSGSPTAIEFVDGDDNILAFNVLPGFLDIVENVWPGDTDNSNVVDQFDLFNIGLAYNATGPLRGGASTNWTGQSAADWQEFTPESGVNFRHIDVNGDGIINAADTTGLSFNWGETTNLWDPHSEQNYPQRVVDEIPLYVMPDTILPGSSVAFDIILGEEELEAQEVYGIAFSIVYDATVVVPGSVYATFEESWFGQVDNNLLTIYKDFSNAGRIDIAMVRTDHSNFGGFGKIGTLNLTIEDVIFRSMLYAMNFDVVNVRLLNVQEEELPVTSRETISYIDITSDTYDPATSDIRLYPNPVADKLYIDTPDFDTIKIIELFDNAGRKVNFTLLAPAVLSLTNLPNGIYTVRITTKQTVVVEQVLISR